MKQSKAWQATQKMPKGALKSPEQKTRATAFSFIMQAIGFTVDFRKIPTIPQFPQCPIRDL